jgi:hypothetical protein
VIYAAQKVYLYKEASSTVLFKISRKVVTMKPTTSYTGPTGGVFVVYCERSLRAGDLAGEYRVGRTIGVVPED